MKWFFFLHKLPMNICLAWHLFKWVFCFHLYVCTCMNTLHIHMCAHIQMQQKSYKHKNSVMCLLSRDWLEGSWAEDHCAVGTTQQDGRRRHTTFHRWPVIYSSILLVSLLFLNLCLLDKLLCILQIKFPHKLHHNLRQKSEALNKAICSHFFSSLPSTNLCTLILFCKLLTVSEKMCVMVHVYLECGFIYYLLLAVLYLTWII